MDVECVPGVDHNTSFFSYSTPAWKATCKLFYTSRKSCILSLPCFHHVFLTLLQQQKEMHLVYTMAVPSCTCRWSSISQEAFSGSLSSSCFFPKMQCLNLLTIKSRQWIGKPNYRKEKKKKGFSEKRSLKPASKDERCSLVSVFILSCWPTCHRRRQYCWQ